MVQKSVNAEVNIVTSTFDVTAGPGSAGTSPGITDKTVSVRITRKRLGGPVEYKAGTAQWTWLDEEQAASIPMDLSKDTLLLRKASPVAAAVQVLIERSIFQNFVLDGMSVPVEASAGVGTITGTSGIGNVLNFVVGEGWTYSSIQWKRQAPNGGAIVNATGPGATTASYTQVAADVVPGTRVFATPTGLSYSASGVTAPDEQPPAPTVPGAPVIGIATAGDGVVNVAFTAPASNGGSPVLDFQALLSTGQTATGASSPISVTAPNGTPVTATARARNSVGYGAYSAASNTVTPSAAIVAPGAPTIVSATPGDGTVSGVWVAPASNGGANITNYRLTWSGGQNAVLGNVLSGSVPGVTNDVPGTLTVAASNNGGASYGPESAPSTSVTPQPAPVVQEYMLSGGVGAPSAGIANGGGLKQFNSRALLYNSTGQAANNLRFRFVNAHIHSSNGTMVAGPTLTLEFGVSAHVPNSGNPSNTRSRVTFNGGDTSVTLAPGEAVWSDPFTFATDMPASGKISTVTYLSYATAPPMLPLTNIDSYDNVYHLSEGAVSGLTSKAVSGSLPISRIASKIVHGPCAVVCTTAAPVTRPRMAVIGNSITSASQSFAQQGTAGKGPWQQASTEGYSYVIMPQGSSPRRFTLEAAHGASHALCFLNVNDIRSGQTTAQIRANMLTLKADLAAMGVPKLIVATCFTNTNSSNNAEASAGLWARLNAHNDAIIANNGVGDGYFDINAITRSPTNHDIWKTAASDGTHPVSSVHTALGVALAAFITDFMIDGKAKPATPTDVVLTAGDGKVTAAFTPGDDGGSTVVEYEVMLSNNKYNSGAASGVDVTTPNGTAVTGRVRARNAVGWSGWSSVSASVTPQQ